MKVPAKYIIQKKKDLARILKKLAKTKRIGEMSEGENNKQR